MTFDDDRKIIEAATPGPWFYNGYSGILTVADVPAHHGDTAWGIRIRDAAFIAAARTRWPLALDELDRLTAQLEAALTVQAFVRVWLQNPKLEAVKRIAMALEAYDAANQPKDAKQGGEG